MRWEAGILAFIEDLLGTRLSMTDIIYAASLKSSKDPMRLKLSLFPVQRSQRLWQFRPCMWRASQLPVAELRLEPAPALS